MGKPKIRFKGYEDDWEQRKLNEVAGKICVGFVGTCEKFYTDESGIPMYRTGNLNGLSLNRDDLKYVTNEFHQHNQKSQLKAGDILIARHGDSGKAVNYENSEEANCLNIVIIRPDFKKCNYKFLTNCINSPECQKHIKSLSAGSTQAVINTSEIEKLGVVIPANIDEQNRIARYFFTLDHLITLHQRKCEETKSLKKYMLQKMFPENGNCVPKIRFSGFADDWEQRKLGSLCDVFTDGDWIEAKDQSDSGIRLVQTGNVGTTEYLDKKNNKKWISEETFERLHCEEIYEGDILISRLPEPAGRACIMPDLGVRMITAVDCTIVRTSKGYDSKYLVQYLSTPMYFKVVNSFLGGGTRQRISRGNLSGIDIPIPSTIDEQGKIGELFANFDHLITLHQHKCDELQKLKKFMLQNMFV